VWQDINRPSSKVTRYSESFLPPKSDVAGTGYDGVAGGGLVGMKKSDGER
jgi:hypothetical protein